MPTGTAPCRRISTARGLLHVLSSYYFPAFQVPAPSCSHTLIPANCKLPARIKHYLRLLLCGWEICREDIQGKVRAKQENNNGLMGVQVEYLYGFFEEALPVAIDYEDICRASNFEAFQEILPQALALATRLGKTHYRTAFAAMISWIRYWRDVDHDMYSYLLENFAN